MGRRLTTTVLALSVAACASIGPSTVPQDRIDYATSIGDSWKQQTLLNIVKLRYGDVPIFLEVAQVVAGYQLQSTIGGTFTAGNFTVGVIGPFTASGSATASGTYTDRPTVIYQPLTGVDFLTRLMTPIPPSSVLFLLQSGYDADRVMPIMLDSINGIYNESTWLRRPADPKFVRLVQLMREVQLGGGLQIRIEHPKGGPESSVLIFGTSKDPQIAAKSQEIRNLLRLKPDLKQVPIYYGGYSAKNNEIDMMTRSMLLIMFEFAAVVQVPESDAAQGMVAPGLVDTQAGQPLSGRTMRILTGTAPPKHAYVAVQYDSRWFWISDTDIQSKTTFEVVILLFSIADTGVKGSAPVVTIPTNQ